MCAYVNGKLEIKGFGITKKDKKRKIGEKKFKLLASTKDLFLGKGIYFIQLQRSFQEKNKEN